MSSPRIRARPPADGLRPPERLEAAGDVEARLEDAAHLRGHATAVVRPATEGEWSWLLASGEKVLVVGAQSSLTGGATPRGETVAVTDRLNRIVRIEETLARVQAGVTLHRLQEELAARGLFYPPVPTYDGCFLGGTVGTNAAGAQTFKHGTTRRWVQALTLVLPGGDLLDVERGQCVAGPDGCFEVEHVGGRVTRVPVPTYRPPAVPKVSAGYWAADGMDLVDLFVGSEGTLGVTLEATVRVVRRTWEPLLVLVLLDSEERGLALAGRLREEAKRTWAARDPGGLDVSAIECLDRRCLEMALEDGVPARLGLPVRPEHAFALMAACDLPAGTSGLAIQDAFAASDEPGARGPVATLGRLLAEHDALDDAVLALPGDSERHGEIGALREAAPEGLGRRIAALVRDVDPRIHKVGGDVIVPFEHVPRLLALARDGAARRGLDLATWGHVSDGNLHPNIVPRSAADVATGEDFLLELGRAVIALGGSPVAEHGVGRHHVKQQLVRELYGDDGVAQMRAVKAALDPDCILAPGVLFPA